MKKITIFTALLAIMPAALSAHYIWLEYEEKGAEARVFYGGVEDNEREVSPGKLDRIKGLKIFTTDKSGATKEVANKKVTTHFSATGVKGAEAIVASALEMPVADMKKYNLGVVKPNYYARFGARTTSATMQPAQTLDILPVAGSENVFQVFYNGKPLENQKFNIYAPNTWQKDYKTDKNGKVKVETPWLGQYVIEVLYTDKTPGKYDGKDYESVRHRATYTFIKK